MYGAAVQARTVLDLASGAPITPDGPTRTAAARKVIQSIPCSVPSQSCPRLCSCRSRRRRWALLIGRFTGLKTGWLMVLVAAASFGLCLGSFSDPAGPTVTFDYPWIPDLGVHLTFRGDSFGLFFASLVSGIGLLVGLYSTYYTAELDNAPRRPVLRRAHRLHGRHAGHRPLGRHDPTVRLLGDQQHHVVRADRLLVRAGTSPAKGRGRRCR